MLNKQAEILGALELGILPPSGNIDKMLATLPADDAHLTKRKFRKLKRKLQKKHPTRSDKTMVRRLCREKGLKILTKS
jgi:hypothetical protein